MADKSQGKSSALKVNKGVERLPDVNVEYLRSFSGRKSKDIPVSDFVEQILKGNRTILSKAITLVESSLSSHYQKAQEIIEKCMPYAANSFRMGITGVPGVGKSTFIESYGMHLIDKGHKIAVLAVDPSSSISKGSILGDKTRMEKLSVNEMAYVRPSPSSGSLGGVARKTREIIFLCEAAGFDRILVETVGVGQSETTVHAMVDFFLLLMLAGAGDELQGIKRGIMEMSDALVINKADGDNVMNAQKAKQQYQTALHLFPPAASHWTPRVVTCSSIKNSGISDIETLIAEYTALTKQNGFFEHKRKEQQKKHMYENIHQTLSERFYSHSAVKENSEQAHRLLMENKITSYQAAEMLLDIYFNDTKG